MRQPPGPAGARRSLPPSGSEPTLGRFFLPPTIVHARLPVSALLLSAVLAGCATPAPVKPPVDTGPIVAPELPTEPVESLSPPAAAVTPPSSVVVVPPPKPAVLTEAQGRALLDRLLPPKTRDRKGWNQDILGAFTALRLPYTAENFCAVAAVIEQESGWQADAPVAGMGTIVWKAIEEKAGHYGVPLFAVKTALMVPSKDGRSYKERIDKVRSERELNLLYEEMVGTVPMIGDKLAMKNPIRTGGPMQVSVQFAEEQVRQKAYPYRMTHGLRDEVFTRRGGVYFGTAILLDYPVSYTEMRYRFADFNAGRHSSRNAAFQQAVAWLTGTGLDLDGDLLNYAPNGAPSGDISNTQRALRGLSGRLKMSEAEINRDLHQEKVYGFEQTQLFQRVFALADQKAGRRVARETMPRIQLKSPKITRKLTTEWFADRVDWRYRTCLARR